MKSPFYYSVIILFFLYFSCIDKEAKELNETVKISLREVGNQLLLANNDSTSLVLPVIKTQSLNYQLSFQKELSIHPDSLVTLIRYNFEKLDLPSQYRVEVIQCSDGMVAYSYQMKPISDDTIIPCSGRELPLSCYTINVQLFNQPNTSFPRKLILYGFGAITIIFVLFGFFKRKKTSHKQAQNNYIKIGRYKFYEIQNKLIKEAQEITLSKKEGELLAILVASPNEVVTREELTKRVWEDNGVIVGRSLDTFISKLRKKFKDDDSVKLTNIHGVGYKLEVS